MNRGLSQISVTLPVDSALFPHHLAEDKFARALRLALGDIYSGATIEIDWNYGPDPTPLTRVLVDGRDSSDEVDDVVDFVWHMRELWQLVWEAVAGSQAGQKVCACQ